MKKATLITLLGITLATTGCSWKSNLFNAKKSYEDKEIVANFCNESIRYYSKREESEKVRGYMNSAKTLMMYYNSKDGGTTLTKLSEAEEHGLYLGADNGDKIIAPEEAQKCFEEWSKKVEEKRKPIPSKPESK